MKLLIYIKERNTNQLEELTRTLNISTESDEISQDITVLSQRKRTQIHNKKENTKENQGKGFNYFYLTNR
jgi:hypothetical protein